MLKPLRHHGGGGCQGKSSKTVSIAVIIVNFNAGETLQKCVHALLNSTEHFRVTIVDNASSDNSAQQLRHSIGDHQGVEFLFNPLNIGFAPAVNLVARRAVEDWVLILNPDCILEPSALRRLKIALQADSNAALAGPAVHDENGQIQRATVRRFPNPWKSLMTVSGLSRLGKWSPLFDGVEVDTKPSKTGAVDAVSGACMLVNRTALESIGYMDEAYKLHCEDLDLMYQLKQKGWHCLYVPEAGCVHLQGLSSRSRPTWVHYQKHRGMARFFNKFQAESLSAPLRVLVRTGIWLRFLVLWPLALLRR